MLLVIFKETHRDADEDETTTDESSPKMKFKGSQIGMQTSTTVATDGGGDESSKFDVIFGADNVLNKDFHKQV